MRLDSALKKIVPNISRPKKSRHFLTHWMSVKLPDNFQMREHSWPCRFHIRLYLDSETSSEYCESLIQSYRSLNAPCRLIIRRALVENNNRKDLTRQYELMAMSQILTLECMKNVVGLNLKLSEILDLNQTYINQQETKMTWKKKTV